MIDIPDSIFFRTTLHIGTVYYYKSAKLKDTTEPHNFIIVHKTNSNNIITVCTTTRIQQQYNYIQLKKLPESTLVFIKPNKNNGLTKDSVVNCNNCFRETESSLGIIRQQTDIKIKGEVSDNIIKQLKQGINDSPLVPMEIKDMLDSK